MAPRAVLMKTGLKSFNTARPVNTVRSVNTGRPFMYSARFQNFDRGYVNFGGGANGGRRTAKLKKKNRHSLKAARTMLADSKLPTTFWAEAVSTACYVQNRVLIVKPHNKTPYELFRENKPMIEGNGPKWLFDIDSLTQSMNYVPVVAGTFSNDFAEERLTQHHIHQETKGHFLLVSNILDDKLALDLQRRSNVEKFETMKGKISMSSMENLPSLGLKILLKKKGIFISQDKHMSMRILRKYNTTDADLLAMQETNCSCIATSTTEAEYVAAAS
ncbi:putative ribonuclease H-like domain-containing protein [Tanacetum coccineum]